MPFNFKIFYPVFICKAYYYYYYYYYLMSIRPQYAHYVILTFIRRRHNFYGRCLNAETVLYAYRNSVFPSLFGKLDAVQTLIY